MSIGPIMGVEVVVVAMFGVFLQTILPDGTVKQIVMEAELNQGLESSNSSLSVLQVLLVLVYIVYMSFPVAAFVEGIPLY
jgi:hypothetical protein